VRASYAFLLATLLCGIAACSETSDSAATGADGAVPPLSSTGRWFTDAHGRVVLLHGFNEVAKSPPFYPAAFGFGDDDAAFLASEGFNALRLGVDFRGLMPEPGAIDDATSKASRHRRRVQRARSLHHPRLSSGRLRADVQRQWPAGLDGDLGRPAEPTRGRVPAVLHSEPGDAARLRKLLEQPRRPRRHRPTGLLHQGLEAWWLASPTTSG
jgi:hypothetical protein